VRAIGDQRDDCREKDADRNLSQAFRANVTSSASSNPVVV
jgi:hypothetical protein